MCSWHMKITTNWRYACYAGTRDAKLLEIYNVTTADTEYSELSSYRKKLVQFCISEHTEEIPLLPIFPLRLATLIRFGW